MKNTITVSFNEADILKVEKAFKVANGRMPTDSDYVKEFTNLALDHNPGYKFVRFEETKNPFCLNFEIEKNDD